MRQKALRLYDQLFEGVSKIVLLDVPDYPNVGDSAIFVGLMNYFRHKGIDVEMASSIDTLNHKFTSQAETVVLLGGGSFGGLYPVSDEHRIFVMSLRSPDALFIQCPQSIHFVSDEFENQICEALAMLKNRRVSVRDKESQVRLSKNGIDAKLLPDSSIFLTPSDFALPDSKVIPGSVVYLVRQDGEALYEFAGSVDAKWLSDGILLRVTSKLRKLGRYADSIANLLNPTPRRWEKIARKRLERGRKILGNAEIVVTDRLHGMILALLAGKKVVALDNSNFKLSRYSQIWLDSEPNLLFVRSLDDVESIITQLLQVKNQRNGH